LKETPILNSGTRF